MTLNERTQVVKLTRALFPNELEVYDNQRCSPECATCADQILDWDALLWRVYNALIIARFSI